MDGADLIAVHKGRYYSTGRNGLALGPGPFVAGLEFASGKKAKILGKPSRDFFLSAIESVNDCHPNQVVMIGDVINYLTIQLSNLKYYES